MLVHGDARNYATALVTLDPDALAQWGRAHGLPDSDYATLAADPSVQEYVHSCVDELNGRLNRWETIEDFRILDHDLSIEADELHSQHEGEAQRGRGTSPASDRRDVRRPGPPLRRVRVRDPRRVTR